jgi:hypothetical protein
MKCEDDEECSEEAVGQDIQRKNLCRNHLEFSIMVQRLCNGALDNAGLHHLVPMEYRFPQDLRRNN